MEEISVERVIIANQGEYSDNYERFRKIVNEKKINVMVVGKYVEDSSNTEKINDNKLQRINIENDLYFDILWPNGSKLIQENILNNNSIVCKLNYKNFSILFTGDIEEIAERKILQEYKSELSILNSKVLKIAHHGSRTSSTKEFIEAVKPKIALIGVGEKNKFGHPNKDVIERLKFFKVDIFRTDKNGEISLYIKSNGKIRVKKYLD